MTPFVLSSGMTNVIPLPRSHSRRNSQIVQLPMAGLPAAHVGAVIGCTSIRYTYFTNMSTLFLNFAYFLDHGADILQGHIYLCEYANTWTDNSPITQPWIIFCKFKQAYLVNRHIYVFCGS
jgi:hypothetical protein